MTRRFFLKMSAALAIAMGWVKRGTAAVVPQRPTLSQVLRASFKDVVRVSKGHGNFVDPDLCKMESCGRIRIGSMGVVVAVPRPGHPLDIKRDIYQVEEVSIPLIWTDQNEHDSDEIRMINTVEQLITNGLVSHDSVLLPKIGEGSAYVCKDYNYDLGEVKTVMEEDGKISYHTANLYTAVSFIPVPHF